MIYLTNLSFSVTKVEILRLKKTHCTIWRWTYHRNPNSQVETQLQIIKAAPVAKLHSNNSSRETEERAFWPLTSWALTTEWDRTCSDTPGPIASAVSRATMAACLRLILASTCVSIQAKLAIMRHLTVDKMVVSVVIQQALSCTSRALFSGPRILLMLVVISAELTRHSKITALQERLQATLSTHQSPQWFLKMRALIKDGRETSNSHVSSIRYRT